MFEIKKYPSIKYGLYNEKKKFIGYIENENEWLNVRLEIIKQNLDGYFVMTHDGTKIFVNRWGHLSTYDFDEVGMSLRKEIVKEQGIKSIAEIKEIGVDAFNKAQETFRGLFNKD